MIYKLLESVGFHITMVENVVEYHVIIAGPPKFVFKAVAIDATVEQVFASSSTVGRHADKNVMSKSQVST